MNRRTFLGRTLLGVFAPRLLLRAPRVASAPMIRPAITRADTGGFVFSVPTTWTAGDIIDATVFNRHVRDGLRYLRLPA